MTFIKTHHNIEITYEINEYAEGSKETIIENIKEILKSYPVEQPYLMRILLHPQKYRKEVQKMILQFHKELQKVQMK